MYKSAVCKIQDGLEITLTANERDSVKLLRRPSDGHDKDKPEALLNVLANRLAKPNKVSNNESSYIDKSFSLGSAAEIELLFRQRKAVLSEYRRSMTPQMLEVLCLLCFKDQLWDAQLVAIAI